MSETDAEAETLADALTEALMYVGDWETQTSEEIGTELAHVLSDWYAAREAAAEARGAERALREAADALTPDEWCRAARASDFMDPISKTVTDWLRARAAQVAPSRVPEEES